MLLAYRVYSLKTTDNISTSVLHQASSTGSYLHKVIKQALLLCSWPFTIYPVQAFMRPRWMQRQVRTGSPRGRAPNSLGNFPRVLGRRFREHPHGGGVGVRALWADDPDRVLSNEPGSTDLANIGSSAFRAGGGGIAEIMEASTTGSPSVKRAHHFPWRRQLDVQTPRPRVC